MRNNNFSSIEQPLIVTSGYKRDISQPSDQRALIKFDLSILPQGMYVKSAKLHLYVLNVFEWNESRWLPLTVIHRTIGVYRVTTFWIGNIDFTSWKYATYPSETWKTPGGDFKGPTDTVKIEIKDTWNEWDVTDDVKLWYDGKYENYGWILKDLNEGDIKGYSVWFPSYKLWYLIDQNYSPKLVVTLIDAPPNQFNYFYIIPLVLAVPLIYYVIRKHYLG
jgi:hypothetical protein